MAEDDIQAEPPEPRRRPRPRPRDDDDVYDVEAEEPVRRRSDPDDDDYDDRERPADDDPVQYVIPYKNPLALVSYYCGVFGLIPCVGFVLGPTAIVLGILGYRRRLRNPLAHGTGHAIAGIVLGSLTSLVHYGGLIAAVVLGFTKLR